MTAQLLLDEALSRLVVPVLRDAGFKGSGKTWRRRNELGDVAIVNVQSSMSSTHEQVRCIINLSIAPLPWLSWFAHSLQKEVPKNPSESWGLYRDRLHAASPKGSWETWWSIQTEAEAETAALDMVQKLRAEGLPTLTRLLDRDRLLQALRTTRKGLSPTTAGRGVALLLAESAASRELEAVLEGLRTDATKEQREYADKFDAWVRSQGGGCGFQRPSTV